MKDNWLEEVKEAVRKGLEKHIETEEPLYSIFVDIMIETIVKLQQKVEAQELSDEEKEMLTKWALNFPEEKLKNIHNKRVYYALVSLKEKLIGEVKNS